MSTNYNNQKKTCTGAPVTKWLITLFIALLITAPALHSRLKSNPGGNNYLLAFNVVDYTPQIKETITVFFEKVITKNDQIVLITPQRAVLIAKEKLSLPKAQLLESIVNVVKGDINKGAAVYRSIFQEMKNDANSVYGSRSGGAISSILANYGGNRKNLQELRSNYQKRLLSYINLFRRVDGKNHMLMVLQKKYRPVPERNTLNALRRSPSGPKVIEVFDSNYKKDINLDRLKAALKYCKIKFHFLYLQTKKIRGRRIDYVEDSGDLYEVYTKLTKATDGIKSTSFNAAPFITQVGMFTKGTVSVEVKDEKMK